MEKYHLKSGRGFTVFEFISEGPNGAIKKLIHFQKTAEAGLYNLAFGDSHPVTGRIDDLAVSNNDDTGKILGTVVAALYSFFDHHPFASVHATGSTASRTRLYRMGITRFYEDVQHDFMLFGFTEEGLLEKFQKGKTYKSFLAQRKFY